MNMQQTKDMKLNREVLARHIDSGGINTIKLLLKRCNQKSLPYSAFALLRHRLLAKQASKVPAFLRKQAY